MGDGGGDGGGWGGSVARGHHTEFTTRTSIAGLFTADCRLPFFLDLANSPRSGTLRVFFFFSTVMSDRNYGWIVRRVYSLICSRVFFLVFFLYRKRR